MSRVFKICAASALLTLAAAPVAALDGDAARGQAAAAVCMACHQADGSGSNIPGGESWPRLAAMNADYIYKQLQDFKSGQRNNASMMPFAMMLNDQQMKDVAVYYSQMPATAGKGGENADEAQLALGEKLATRGDWSKYIPSCRSCHGPDNQGAGSHFPGIAGQHAGYIEQQLRNWQQGTRSNDPQNLMHAIAERMSDDDIKAAAAWLSRQPAK
jgi:cytochrome c553